MRDHEEELPGGLTYWQKRERWAALGRKVELLKREAKCQGVPLAALPGAPTLVAAFKTLGKELDRHVK